MNTMPYDSQVRRNAVSAAEEIRKCRAEVDQVLDEFRLPVRNRFAPPNRLRSMLMVRQMAMLDVAYDYSVEDLLVSLVNEIDRLTVKGNAS